MNQSIKLITGVLMTSAALLMAGCSSSSKKQSADTQGAPPAAEAQKGKYSGFLGDYSAFQEVKDEKGDKVLRYVNPKLQPGMYKAILLEPTRFYPEPQPSEQVDANTLASIQKYMDTQIRTSLNRKVRLASQPGPGVLRVRPAITAVGGEKAKLKPYQYIPVAFVVTTVAGRKEVAAINMEIDATDSMTGERMAASVRSGEGAKLANDQAKVTVQDVKPLLDKWIDTGSTAIAQYVR